MYLWWWGRGEGKLWKGGEVRGVMLLGRRGGGGGGMEIGVGERSDRFASSNTLPLVPPAQGHVHAPPSLAGH